MHHYYMVKNSEDGYQTMIILCLFEITKKPDFIAVYRQVQNKQTRSPFQVQLFDQILC